MGTRFCTTVLIFFAVLLPGVSPAWAFNDVPLTHPEHDAIGLLEDLKVIGGFEDGSFRPEEQVTRAAVVQVAMLASGQVPYLLPAGRAPSYPDLDPTAPATGFIERAAQKGYLKPDGTTPFRPKDPATRVEGLKLALTIFGIIPPPAEAAPAPDVRQGTWEASFVAYAKQHALLRTEGAGFNPAAPLTRGQLARIVATLVRERGDAARPLAPAGVMLPLALGWLLCAVPLARRALRLRPGWRASLGIVAAAILGPLGALAVLGRRLGNERVREAEDQGEATTRRRVPRRFTGFRRWLGAAQLDLLALLLVCGFLAVVIDALMIMLATAQIQSSLLAHG